jgi:lipoprotein-anchoring transpeptidase ErfK/SrfK
MAEAMTTGRVRVAAKVLIGLALVIGAAQLTGIPSRLSAANSEAPAPKPAPVSAKPAVTASTTVSAAEIPAPELMPAPAPIEDGLFVKRVLKIAEPFEHGDYVWDDAGVPAGPLVITVDLAAQTMSVFRNGYEIGAAVIVYGADEKPTPLGTFPIMQKDRHHVSNLYGAPMPYMLRLTGDGVAIHASDVAYDAATHGCIGVPSKFAALLFAQAKLGDRVIITNGKMLDTGRLPAAA